MRQRKVACLRSIISIPAVNPCVPLEAQPWGDAIRCKGQRVSSAAMPSEVGERKGAPLARTVPWSAPRCRTRRAGLGPASWPTDKLEAAQVAVAGAPVEVVAPPVAARYTLAVAVEASPAAAAVVAVLDTTDSLSHCIC